MRFYNRLILLVLTHALVGMPISIHARVANGFDLSDSLIPAREIRQGGPPRDGILALTEPARTTAEIADGWLDDDDRVMGLVLGGEAVAYPIRILNWHEVVNDIVGESPVVVTYCPLCGSGVVFKAIVKGRRSLFGVSGLLYNSDVLLYDHATESLFSQLLLKAISGPLSGTELETLPAVTTSWDAWRTKYPHTQVVSRALPYRLDYGTDPYQWYRRTGRTMFPVQGADRSRNAKAWAYLVLADDEKLLVAQEDLQGASRNEVVRGRVGESVVLEYDPANRELVAQGGPSGSWTVIPGYWFALTAFHPDARQLEAEDLKTMGSAGQETPAP